MKARLSALAFATCAVLASSHTNAQRADDQLGKFICVLEKAAGVLYANSDAKEPIPGPINFEERHKKFVLTIKRIVRSQQVREMCRSNLAFWMPLLSEKGTFDPSIRPDFSFRSGNFSDFRTNIGRHCFSTDEATIKFFDRDFASTLESYDFPSPRHFVGLPGEWLKLYTGGKFEAGEALDLGPVVFTGTCEPIEP